MGSYLALAIPVGIFIAVVIFGLKWLADHDGKGGE